ncbi:uncharacterized protein [Eurosta solidaginis]|uniref:uncharacterized protein n=1 Tax=Eurosta solidaginis TaxID=178769 RepID=UPI003530747D
MSKHIFKKFEAQNKNSSTAAIPAKKVKFSDENSYPRTSSVTCASESTIESRRISLSSSVIEHTTEATQSFFEVVCCSHCKIFERQLQSIEKNLEKLDHLQMIVDTQNTAIMDAIAGLKVATEQLVRQEVQNTPVVKYFPLCDVYEMQQLDEKITSSNTDVYESTIASILCNNIKNLPLIIKTDVIIALNLDGTHGKIGLKSFPNLYSALAGAVSTLPFKGLTPEDMLRKGLQFSKSKHFKKLHRQKNRVHNHNNALVQQYVG